MTTWVTPKTWVAASAVTAAELNEVRDDLLNIDERLTLHGLTSPTTLQPVLTAPYGCSFTLTGQSVSTGSDVSLSFADSDEEWETVEAMHTDSAPARFYPQGSYTYDVRVWAQFAANATGRRELWIERSDSTQYNRIRIPAVEAAAGTGIYTAAIIPMTAGQYLTAYVRQSSGTALDVSARFQMLRVGA